MKYRYGMLTILVFITAAEVPLIVTDLQNATATLPRVAAMVVLWGQYLYRFVPPVRMRLVQAIAIFGPNAAVPRLTARYIADEQPTVADLLKVARSLYPNLGEEPFIKVEPVALGAYVHLPTWTGQLRIGTIDSEDDSLGFSQVYELLFTVAGAKSPVSAIHALLGEDIAPFLETMASTLSLRLQSVSLAVTFTSGRNPFLAGYLQNIDLERIRTVSCVVDEMNQSSRVAIYKDSIEIGAGAINELRNLARKHLSFTWSVR